jgi:hypothetical protein
VAQWAKGHPVEAQNWVKADRLNSDFVAGWMRAHPEEVAGWVHPGRWLREYLLRQGKGVLHLAPGVSGLLEIALKFHEPALG